VTHPSVAENPTVHRRQLDFATWPAVFGDIDHLQRAGYDRLGNWDLSQTLEHVGAGLRAALRGTDHRGPWIIRRFLGPLILKRILSQRRMKAGIKVPAWWLPGPSHDESAAIDQFRAEVTALNINSGWALMCLGSSLASLLPTAQYTICRRNSSLADDALWWVGPN